MPEFVRCREVQLEPGETGETVLHTAARLGRHVNTLFYFLFISSIITLLIGRVVNIFVGRGVMVL